VAFIESIAKARNKNLEMARSFVITSVSITDDEALKNNVIDLVAKDREGVMSQADGKVVELQNGEKITLNTKNVTFKSFEKSFRQKALEILSNPNLFYLLFLAGIIGIGYELTHPGVLFPGVAGVICMILALIATSVVPINLGFGALVIAGIAMMIAEMFIPSFGILGIGGFIAFIIGSVFLVDTKESFGLAVSWYIIAPAAGTVLAALLGIGYVILSSQKRKISSGQEGMVGAQGEVLENFAGDHGKVRVAGEIWAATLTAPGSSQLVRGDLVVVERSEGMKLFVRRV
jgi:membrane-bound serine protease (ClpP class)